jgi:ABC-type polysaccharide/polyol phosphate transport system ATPase subunit
MSDISLRMEHVFKKFRKGENYDSLRDLVPALTGKLFRTKELSKRAKREFWALQDVSFEVKRGEAFGIIGHNGAGKSTLLKLLSRIMKPTSGTFEVVGRLSALIEVTAGFHPDLTGRENIYLNGAILGMTRREIESKFEEIVEFSGLAEFIDTPVKRYSSGMNARLGFSVASHVNPEVLIVDEVLSVGDNVFQQACMERMRSVIHGGATVVFVSHNLKALSELCQRAMLLEHGKVVTIGSTDSALRQYLSDTAKPISSVTNKAVYVSQVTVRSQTGEQSKFESGATAWVDIELKAREAVEKLAVQLWINDQSQYLIFDTSTERLGEAPFSLQPGDIHRCTFELTLNIAHGTFQVCAGIYRYDIQKEYDRRSPAATVFIGSTLAVRGAVNCFPRLVQAETVAANSAFECKV